MPQNITHEIFAKTVAALLEETFVDVKGIYLDGKTSLTETLAGLSAGEASRPAVDGGTTIAGHAAHISFYLDALKRYMDDNLKERIDWSQSWLVKEVSVSEWDTLCKQMADDYAALKKRFSEVDDWNDDKRLGGALAIIAHTAYHLGAIRQILKGVKR